MWGWLVNMSIWYTATDPYEEDTRQEPEVVVIELSPTEYIESIEIREE